MFDGGSGKRRSFILNFTQYFMYMSGNRKKAVKQKSKAKKFNLALNCIA